VILDVPVEREVAKMERIIIRSHSIRLASCDRRPQQRPAEKCIRITLLEVEKASFASTLHPKPLSASHSQLYYRGNLSLSRSSSTSTHYLLRDISLPPSSSSSHHSSIPPIPTIQHPPPRHHIQASNPHHHWLASHLQRTDHLHQRAASSLGYTS
jgi:hypothetical protein